jgi:hypothetical protein
MIDIEVSRPCHEVTRFDVWHDEPLPYRQCHATGGRRIGANPSPEGNCFRINSSPGQQPKFLFLGTVLLHATHVGGHQADRSVENALVKGVEVSLLNQQSAYFL